MPHSFVEKRGVRHGVVGRDCLLNVKPRLELVSGSGVGSLACCVVSDLILPNGLRRDEVVPRHEAEHSHEGTLVLPAVVVFKLNLLSSAAERCQADSFSDSF